MWTRFMDMHSGGGCKESPYERIYIESSGEEEAKVIFYNRFGHNPDRVTCTCCGNDYSIYTYETIQQATAFDRGCDSGYVNADGVEVPDSEAWVRGKGLNEGYKDAIFERQRTKYSFGDPYVSLDEYKKSETVLFINEAEIKDEERKGDIPEQGYVWRD